MWTEKAATKSPTEPKTKQNWSEKESIPSQQNTLTNGNKPLFYRDSFHRTFLLFLFDVWGLNMPVYIQDTSLRSVPYCWAWFIISLLALNSNLKSFFSWVYGVLPSPKVSLLCIMLEICPQARKITSCCAPVLFVSSSLVNPQSLEIYCSSWEEPPGALGLFL